MDARAIGDACGDGAVGMVRSSQRKIELGSSDRLLDGRHDKVGQIDRTQPLFGHMVEHHGE